WRVVMRALGSRLSCCRRCRLSGWSRRALVRALLMRSRISPAAASVKVTTSMRSTSTGSWGRVMRRMTRSTSTAVLPVPAPAATSTSVSCTVMAASWASVHLGPAMALFLPGVVHVLVVDPLAVHLGVDPLPHLVVGQGRQVAVVGAHARLEPADGLKVAPPAGGRAVGLPVRLGLDPPGQNLPPHGGHQIPDPIEQILQVLGRHDE